MGLFSSSEREELRVNLAPAEAFKKAEKVLRKVGRGVKAQSGLGVLRASVGTGLFGSPADLQVTIQGGPDNACLVTITAGRREGLVTSGKGARKAMDKFLDALNRELAR